MSKQISEISKSSERLVNFLEEKNVHKKDFAQMIGVTLSYIYSLIDEKIPFSSRITTLERIAVVMGLDPEEFEEYRPSDEPKLLDPGVEFLQNKQKEQGLSNIDFIRKFPRQKRLEIVDLWRGAAPLPLDWNSLTAITEVLNISKEEVFPYWQARFQQYLMAGGIDVFSNIGLINSMLEGAKKYLSIK